AYFTLEAGEGGGALALRRNASELFSVRPDASGSGGELRLNHGSGRPLLTVSADQEVDPFVLGAADGATRFIVAMRSEGARLGCFDAGGKPVFTAGATTDGGALRVSNIDGRSVFFAAARPDGGGRVEVGGETGAPALTL